MLKKIIKFYLLCTLVLASSFAWRKRNPLNTTSLGDNYCLEIKTRNRFYFAGVTGFWSYRYQYKESNTGILYDTLDECVEQYTCVEGGFRYGKEVYHYRDGSKPFVSMQYSHLVETPASNENYCEEYIISHHRIEDCHQLLRRVLLRRK